MFRYKNIIRFKNIIFLSLLILSKILKLGSNILSPIAINFFSKKKLQLILEPRLLNTKKEEHKQFMKLIVRLNG